MDSKGSEAHRVGAPWEPELYMLYVIPLLRIDFKLQYNVMSLFRIDIFLVISKYTSSSLKFNIQILILVVPHICKFSYFW